MVLVEAEAGSLALSSNKEARQNGAPRNGLKSVTNGQGNGDTPFTEGDVGEVYQDRYDFFRNELKLTDEAARKRATESTEAWRREVFSIRRK